MFCRFKKTEVSFLGYPDLGPSTPVKFLEPLKVHPILHWPDTRPGTLVGTCSKSKPSPLWKSEFSSEILCCRRWSPFRTCFISTKKHRNFPCYLGLLKEDPYYWEREWEYSRLGTSGLHLCSKTLSPQSWPEQDGFERTFNSTNNRSTNSSSDLGKVDGEVQVEDEKRVGRDRIVQLRITDEDTQGTEKSGIN